jgi:xanthine/CO dehydrogenase XdhC/CoxF family maturation factor
MRITCKKRANWARARQAIRKAFLFGIPLVLGVSAIRETWKLGAQCNGEAKVTLERIGPNGTFAGVRG